MKASILSNLHALVAEPVKTGQLQTRQNPPGHKGPRQSSTIRPENPQRSSQNQTREALI